MSEATCDPSKRYIRRDLVRQQGPRITYNAIDQDEGTEVLWHEVTTTDASDTHFKQLCSTVKLLGAINHRNLLRLHHAWVDNTRHHFVYITELGTETLRDYVKKVVHHPSQSIISNWCSQIVSAIEELHNSGITHRNLTCDNIFFDSVEGVVKVGLPGLENILYDLVLPVAAPESVDDPKGDVWLFGLCVIELCTGEEPYRECPTDEEKRRKICEHGMPLAFSEVPDPLIADLVVTCLLPIEQRPTAAQLRENQLLADLSTGDSSSRRSQDEIRMEEKVGQGQLTKEEAKRKQEFVDLLSRQNAERAALLRQQKEVRHTLRVKIRDRQQKRSLRELLGEIAT